MEFELKSISREAAAEALEKAERYRLLNEPWQAESICLDILRVDSGNQVALVTLLLSLTDQFGVDVTVSRARQLLPSLDGEYARHYYAGIICERSARAHINLGAPGSCFIAYEELLDAMQWYVQAEALRPAGNDDAILRWNTCARTLMRHHELRQRPVESLEPVLDD